MTFGEVVSKSFDVKSGVFVIPVKVKADLTSTETNEKLAKFFKYGRTITLLVYKSFMDVPGNERRLESELFDYLAREGKNEVFKQEYDHELECYIITIVKC